MTRHGGMFMSSRKSRWILLWLAAPVFCSVFAAAYAQEIAAPALTSQVKKRDSSKTPFYSKFPSLPPARLCKSEDIVDGAWRMIALYEQPPADEAKSLKAAPMQYIRFSRNSLYKEVKFAQRVQGRDKFYASFEYKDEDSLQQYLLHETGFIYFYKEGNVVDTRQCLIVTTPQASFKVGEMLLVTPPKPAGEVVVVRSLRHYHQFGKHMLNDAPDASGENT